MSQIHRLFRELRGLWPLLSWFDWALYLVNLVVALPACLRRRTLAPADSRMNRDIVCRVNGRDIVVPVGRIATLIAPFDSTPTFGGLREMYASNVYLRAFRPGMAIDVALDLGANRGLFSLLAIKAHGARLAIGVEPLEGYDAVADLLRHVNGVAPAAMPRVVARAASSAGAGAVTVAELMARWNLEWIDLLKCDIEGGEFDVLLVDSGFLAKVGNIAMELHPEAGSCPDIVDALTRSGFTVLTTDQHGAPTGPRHPHYLYASRTGDLVLGA
ncbi:MAG: FkbM family methyltransferase [Alphaproteobacteria bacterium]|nr:FkbM family methyltransferase [Alphaproteobacteria bacterium]